MLFWNSLGFLMIHWMLAIWSLGPLLFLNPAWTSGSSWFMCCWSLAWRILSITLLACAVAAAKLLQSFPTLWDPMDCSLPGSSIHGIFQLRVLDWVIIAFSILVCEMSAIVQYFEHSLALPFFGIGMQTDLFQSCGHWWVFQICWHIEWSTLTESSFRIWNS